jgi:two-component system, cell cycle sensor histidine kinase and response regulator CckA
MEDHDVFWNKIKSFRPLIIIITLLIFFGASFLPLHSTMQNGAFVFASIFPLAAGWLLGLRLGLVYWLLHSILLSILARMVGSTLHNLMTSGIPSFAVTLILTAGIGRISDLTKTLQQYKQKLEKLVEVRTAELLKSNEQLKLEIIERERVNKDKLNLEASLKRAEKMEAVGILAGSVAHDLNNILSGILSYPELLLLDLPDDSPLKKPLLTIKNSGEKAAAVVQDLLTLARRGIINTQVVNLNQIISELLTSPECLKLASEYPGINIGKKLSTELLHIHGSPVHLSKAIMNLISNSMEAMKKGGQLVISTANVYIDRPEDKFEVLEEGEYVTVEISDIGEGISQEDLDKIFEPFYTNKIMGRSGTGLGLTIVWGTVKDHNGYIDVQSVVGEGTRFILYFPATRESLLIKDSSLKWDDNTGKGESILIVDDVELQRNICTSILTKLGYAVFSVGSGEEAIEYLRNNTADLMVLDMIMGSGMDGLETYQMIVASIPNQKAIIVSGFAESDRVKKTQALGAGAFLKKPYTMKKLALAVKNELKQMDR